MSHTCVIFTEIDRYISLKRRHKKKLLTRTRGHKSREPEDVSDHVVGGSMGDGPTALQVPSLWSYGRVYGFRPHGLTAGETED